MTEVDDTTTTLLVPTRGRNPVPVELPGALLAGRYQIGKELGRGGMSVVYRATDTETGEARAVKVGLLRTADDALPERLAAEATILMFLRHPNLVAVHDMGTDLEHGLHYAVMDLALGGSLARRRKTFGTLPLSEVVEVGLQLCFVLSVLHRRGIVHRDVKPSNLLLSADGRVLLADLGISKIPDAFVEPEDDTVMGSFTFMAPEQLTGMSRVGPTGDIYALGTTLFNLATGKSPSHLFAIHEASERWLLLPEPLRPIVRACCKLEPDQRPCCVSDVARQLAPLADPQRIAEQPHLTEWLESPEGKG